MKYIFSIVFTILTLASAAQSKEMIKVLANTRLLENTVFGSKDSATLEKLFAKTVSYIHSSGKVETREEAIPGIIHNKSVYEKLAEPKPYNVSIEGDSAIVKQEYRATEKKADGTESKLNLLIETVWMKEKKDWKLTRRLSTKIQ